MQARIPSSQWSSVRVKQTRFVMPAPRAVAEPMATPMREQSRSVDRHPWDEVAQLQQALRDAEAEREQWEQRLALHETQTKNMVSKQRQLAMQQAKAKLAVQELQGLVGDAKTSAAAEHRQLFAERLNVCGKSFRDETSSKAFIARQERGMQRLSMYDRNLSSLTSSLLSLVSE